MTFHVDDEIASQPRCWAEAIRQAPEAASMLPAAGKRVAFVGCGTSWFVAQVLASWRESSGQGESDAFSASEMPARSYDHVVALTRSGTTTEVVELLSSLRGASPTTVVTADLDTPVVDIADQVVDLSFANERSVVQTTFATSTLALFRTLFGPAARNGPDLVEQARTAVEEPLPADLPAVEQLTFLGRGWTIGLAHEAALKFRETSSSWAESYPAMDYRHGPIAIAAPNRAVWMLGQAPRGLPAEVADTGATFVETGRDPMIDLITAQRVAVARAVRRGVNPDQPRHLARSVVLPA